MFQRAPSHEPCGLYCPITEQIQVSLAQARESDDWRDNFLGGNLKVELNNNQPEAINVPSKRMYLDCSPYVPSRVR